MNILIAPDTLKNAASTFEVADAIEAGFAKAIPGAVIRKLPLADGGENTLEVIRSVWPGELRDLETVDPLGRPVSASFLAYPNNRCIIELSRASGFGLVEGRDKNPLITSTFGTGLMIKEAIRMGCHNITLALGGSATVDGGAGILQALGVKLFDKGGNELPPGGGNLIILERFDPSELIPEASDLEFRLLCDVQNPLLGANGAAMVFAPQKGAGPMEAAVLERCLTNFAYLCESWSGKALADKQGAGAAGGVAVGLGAFFNTTMHSGIDFILDMLNADEHISWADIVVTAEGSLDHQTFHGKAPAILATRAKREGKKVICLAGAVPHRANHPDDLFDAVFSLQHKPMSLTESISNTAANLENVAFEAGRLLH